MNILNCSADKLIDMVELSRKISTLQGFVEYFSDIDGVDEDYTEVEYDDINEIEDDKEFEVIETDVIYEQDTEGYSEFNGEGFDFNEYVDDKCDNKDAFNVHEEQNEGVSDITDSKSSSTSNKPDIDKSIKIDKSSIPSPSDINNNKIPSYTQPSINLNNTAMDSTNDKDSTTNGLNTDLKSVDMTNMDRQFNRLYTNFEPLNIVPEKTISVNEKAQMPIEDFVRQQGGDLPLSVVRTHYSETEINKAIKNVDIIVYTNVKEGCKYVCV